MRKAFTRNEWFVNRARLFGFIVWPGLDGKLMVAWPSEMIPEDDNSIHPRDLLASIEKEAMQCSHKQELGVV